jgi:hypothetical protein
MKQIKSVPNEKIYFNPSYFKNMLIVIRKEDLEDENAEYESDFLNEPTNITEMSSLYEEIFDFFDKKVFKEKFEYYKSVPLR